MTKLRNVFASHENRFIIGVLCFHAVKMGLVFKQVDFASRWPLTSMDYLLYYARALRCHEFMVRSGRFWGYDPFEMAGYVAGPIHEAGNHLLSLACHLLSPWISIRTSLLSMELAGIIFAPLAVVVFVRLLGGTRLQSWASFAIFSSAYLIFEIDLLLFGLFGFNMGFFASLILIGVFYRWMRGAGLRYWFCFTFLACLVPQLHPAAVMIPVLPLLGIYIAHASKRSSIHHLLLVATCLAAFLANYYWILPTVYFKHWMEYYPIGWTSGWKSFSEIFIPLHGFSFMYVRSSISLCMTIFVWSAFRRTKTFSRVELIFFCFWLGVFGFVGSLATQLGFFRELQPFRFFGVFWGVLAAFSGMGLPTTPGPSRSKSIFLCCLSVFGSYSLLVQMNIFPLRATNGIVNILPQQDFIDHLKRQPLVPGRFLIESSEFRLEKLSKHHSHMNDIIPSQTGQTLLGGPLPYVFMRSRLGVFMGEYINGDHTVWDYPVVFKRALEIFPEDDFGDMLTKFHVTKIAAHSRMSIYWLNKMKKILRLTHRAGTYNFYDVVLPSTWFFAGSGSVALDYDRISLRDASPGRIVIKTHWLDTFETSSGVDIFPVHYGFDPVPFVGIDNRAGVKNILITNGGIK